MHKRLLRDFGKMKNLWLVGKQDERISSNTMEGRKHVVLNNGMVEIQNEKKTFQLQKAQFKVLLKGVPAEDSLSGGTTPTKKIIVWVV